MHTSLQLTIALALWTGRETLSGGDCIGGQCCVNYYMKKQKCIPCENGTFGKNCEQRCPRFYYGRFCRSKCSCNGTECEPVYGNCYWSGKVEDGNTHNFVHQPFFWASVSGVFIVLALAIGLALIRNLNKNRWQRHTNNSGNDSSNGAEVTLNTRKVQENTTVCITGITLQLQKNSVPLTMGPVPANVELRHPTRANVAVRHLGDERYEREASYLSIDSSMVASRSKSGYESPTEFANFLYRH